MKAPNLPQFGTKLSELPDELILKVLQQFQKDLNKVGIPYNRSESAELTVNQLLSTVKVSLTKLFSKQEERFWQLLYVVDLPEPYLSNIEASDKGLEECARVVLIREWQKVIYRQHFSAS